MTEVKKPFFSIIVPVYKVEAFLEQCLKSVKGQTFTDFECIVINDGSPGVSQELWKIGQAPDYQPEIDLKGLELDKQAKYIFDQICKNDKRFKYIYQSNQGLGAARNTGMNAAKGERLVLLDSDDFLHHKYLEIAFESINQNQLSDIFFGSLINYNHGKLEPFVPSQKFVPANNNLKTMLVFPTWTVTAVNYFWRLDIIRKHNLQFPITRGEDTIFAFNCALAYYREFGKLNYVNIPNIYFYRQFQNQMTRSQSFETQLFEATSDFTHGMKQEFYKIDWVHGLLAHLFVLRFRIYKERSLATNNLKKIILHLHAKFLTIIAILVAGVTPLTKEI
ncbi:MAG: hypothetical protein OHK0017_05860 [Patescibacteria group bacterium]